jgi:hypothetical protein
MKDTKTRSANIGGAGPIYFFGFIGSAIYYVQVVDGFWRIVLAFLKAVVWPAFLTHDVLKFIVR